MVRGKGSGPAGDAPRNPSRRAFFAASGIAAASGLVVGGAAGAAIEAGTSSHPDLGFTPLAPRSEPGFDHVVVLMFENRSFDSILGRLYDPADLASGRRFEGLGTGQYSNTAPDGTVVPAHVYDGSTDFVMGQPDPDPGEFYSHVNTQLYGIVAPAANEDIAHNGVSAPFNAPPPGAKPTMEGFLHDYVINFRAVRGREPTPDEYRVVMGGFSRDMLPVMSTLATDFGVYDHWFSGVPSQTFCNRSFFHASTSHGFVTNAQGGGYRKWLDAEPEPTIFNRLEDGGVAWRVYYDEEQLVSLTGVLHAPVLEKYWKSNFRVMGQFFDDVRNGNLPAYSFIEPRMIFDHNDMHPPHGVSPGVTADGESVGESALSDVRAGEALLAAVYTAIKGSRSARGSNAMNTALLVVFDEHGGIYDHVPPRPAVPPSGDPIAGEMGFTFDRLGCRVPAIVVSAYTRAGTIIHDEMHHGSVINTLARLHGLRPLSQRDETANAILNAVNLDRPRQPALWPDARPAWVPANPEASPPTDKASSRHPLSPPAVGLLGILLAKYAPHEPVPDNYADAYATLHRHGTGLFGVRD